MKKNKIIYSIIFIGIIAMLIVLGGRINSERNNKRVEVILDYYEFREMSKQSEETLSQWFSEFKSLGINHVALREESLYSLVEDGAPIKVEMSAHIFKEYNWEEKYPKELVEYYNGSNKNDHDVVAITDSKELYDFISEGLIERYDTEKFQLINGDESYIIVLKGTVRDTLYSKTDFLVDSREKGIMPTDVIASSRLTYLTFGFDPNKIAEIREAGLEIYPRPFSYRGWVTEKYVNAFIKNYQNLGMKPSVFIFDGEIVLGFPDELHLVIEHMYENNIKAALIETSVQRQHLEQVGLRNIVQSTNYNAVRLFSVPEYIQERYGYYQYQGAEEIENTLYRAVTERNIRLILFRPFKYDKQVYVTNVEDYQKMFERFEGRLEEHGMSLGEASVMDPHRVRLRYMLLMGWGTAAAAVLLFSNLFKVKDRHKFILLILGILGVTGMIFLMPSLGEKVLALAASIIWSSLGVFYYIHRCSHYFKDNSKVDVKRALVFSVKELFIASGISLIGALSVAAILSSIQYLLEMDIYRGVKISQLLPIFVFGLVFLKYFGYRRDKDENNTSIQLSEIKRLLLENIKIIYVLAGGILLVAGYIYISRTGHETNIKAFEFELIMRNILEENLLARPRTKEFIIGFPLMIMGIYYALKGNKYLIILAGLGAVMGQTSIINTFSHLRTPLYISTIRTLYSLIFGIGIGLVYIAIMEAGIKVINKVLPSREEG
ncbi:DUF5693 family protein [Alkaliphilus serpentinus]|uniref:Uncharacterized protein n=1 Tax=Alkaliphilus serpentinus TaxID=1482731 RepID=A0A833HRP8_9FIRM|nr:DUF5693 family protein [Alkaliphilus serpentinus]KAB3533554.1 hypothetical protein F8153_00440 [Alkaliphilus serpentinus]